MHSHEEARRYHEEMYNSRQEHHHHHRPEHSDSPPGQYNNSPGQYNGPPGQYNNPSEHYNSPPGQYNNPEYYNNPPEYQNNQPEHEAKVSHELLGAGLGFAAMKAWEDRNRAEGKPVSHAVAKEALAGLVGWELDKLAETKGRDWYDREQVKRHAIQHAEHMYDSQYSSRNAQEWRPEYESHEVFRN